MWFSQHHTQTCGSHVFYINLHNFPIMAEGFICVILLAGTDWKYWVVSANFLRCKNSLLLRGPFIGSPNKWAIERHLLVDLNQGLSGFQSDTLPIPYYWPTPLAHLHTWWVSLHLGNHRPTTRCQIWHCQQPISYYQYKRYETNSE